MAMSDVIRFVEKYEDGISSSFSKANRSKEKKRVFNKLQWETSELIFLLHRTNERTRNNEKLIE